MAILKIKNLELRIKNLPLAKKLKIEARRQGDESLLSITNEWLKARVFAKVPAERSEDEN